MCAALSVTLFCFYYTYPYIHIPHMHCPRCSCCTGAMIAKVRKWYADFKSITSVHGLAYTIDRGRVSVLLWYAAVALGISLIYIYCSDLLTDWHERPLAHPFGKLDRPVTEIQVGMATLKCLANEVSKLSISLEDMDIMIIIRSLNFY